MRAYSLAIPNPPARLLNVNTMRGHSLWHAKLTAAWRRAGAAAAAPTDLPRPFLLPVRIWVEVRFEDNRRRDTTNLFPTAKALVDGLVDNGVLLDDRDGFVEGPWLKRVYPNGSRYVRIVIEEVERGRLGRSIDLAELSETRW